MTSLHMAQADSDTHPGRPPHAYGFNRSLQLFFEVLFCPLSDYRSSRSVSKGAQWILYRLHLFDSLTDALADADLSVAMTRWLPDQPNCLPNLQSLLQQPLVQQVLQQPLVTVEQSHQQQQQQYDGQQQQRPVRLALVFGREEFGLSDDEVAACDLACSIPIGRLQVNTSCTARFHHLHALLSPFPGQKRSNTATVE